MLNSLFKVGVHGEIKAKVRDLVAPGDHDDYEDLLLELNKLMKDEQMASNFPYNPDEVIHLSCLRLKTFFRSYFEAVKRTHSKRVYIFPKLKFPIEGCKRTLKKKV